MELLGKKLQSMRKSSPVDKILAIIRKTCRPSESGLSSILNEIALEISFFFSILCYEITHFASKLHFHYFLAFR